jgi:transcriptional regulator with XRE-family HTH domain
LPVWTFGDRIRKARSLVKLGQREFAVAIDVTDSSLAAWETDRSTPRDIVTVAKRVELLTRIPASWLLGVDSPQAPQPPDKPVGYLPPAQPPAPIIELRPTG